VVLSTPRLTLTTWVEEDLDELSLLHSDPATMRYVRRGRPESREESRALLGLYLREQAARGWTKWRVADENGRLASRAGFGAYGQDRELGYMIRRDMWGQGLASEIAQALVRWHREHNDTEPPMRLLAYAVQENLPSRRVLEKAGLVLTGCADHNGRECAVYELPAEF